MKSKKKGDKNLRDGFKLPGPYLDWNNKQVFVRIKETKSQDKNVE